MKWVSFVKFFVFPWHEAYSIATWRLETCIIAKICSKYFRCNTKKKFVSQNEGKKLFFFDEKEVNASNIHSVFHIQRGVMQLILLLFFVMSTAVSDVSIASPNADKM